ncbi:uncharacterized protein TRUGW13939_11008 [Talaromyces rugulosus]|uniref:Uncharacterized protein n=1 Tax=Talaromyces rugulosus TaxID=121627 RepID=A0A7H8RCM9_TALRU|nr:uncharacterized protein TRUGW13939_11008 [Talaromyces rugulosus]QKX63837.1 hypothetical protein TRUGW13939_11008 [Talaromyces rugulosus]
MISGLDGLTRHRPSNPITQTETKQENMSPPGPLPSSSGQVVLGGDAKLPAHLLELLEEWHKEHPTDPAPPCYHRKNSVSMQELLATTKVFSRNFEELEPCVEITVEKPVRYKALWLSVPDGDKTGVFVKNWSWGRRRTFLKKWRGGYDFQDEPIAVRQGKLLDGSFGEAPDQEMWETVTKRSLQSITAQTPESSSNAKRRRIESDAEQSTSSGEDIPASSGPSKQLRQSIQSASRQSKQSRPSVTATADEDSGSSVSGLDSQSDSESNSDEPLAGSISRKASKMPSSTQSGIRSLVNEATASNPQPNNNNPTRHTPRQSNNSNTQTSTRPPRQSHIGTLTPVTATDSVTTPTAENRNSRSGIRFKLIVPRTKMVRDLRVEDDEDTPEYLFNQTKDFFRRYDRLIGTPVLECVVDGEMECRCIYNAKELGYFLEELRERGGPIKVTITQTA